MPDGDDPSKALDRWNRLLVLLVTDALRLEHDAADGRTEILGKLRPDKFAFSKRCRLGLRVIRTALGESAPTDQEIVADPIGVSRAVCETVEAGISAEERRFLRLSVLPVYVAHDEYLFIRVLQSFEAAFAMMAVLVRTAIAGLADGKAQETIDALSSAESVLRRSAPLFSLLATMQVISFRTFREFTDGASAIQSRNYKMLEALCRRQDPERLDSAAYLSVPEVRRQAMAGMTTLDDTLLAVRRSGRLAPQACDEVTSAMDRFANRLTTWRKTHYRLALRMLGDARGTGYTEGTPYLGRVTDIPVFLSTTE
jgi:tryptophan 2,3-dioxygenase